MTRTDNDTWDITESVGATALGVAMARAYETASVHPLFTDHYAQVFLDAAAARGWRSPAGAMGERIRTISDYAAARTKWFDDFFIAAGGTGIRQAVILAAGLDARAWRLPWIPDSTVYEIDQPKVLQFKADALRGEHAESSAGYVAVPVDLREDWPKALQDGGFDVTQPTAWSVEGLLPYLPADAQDLLFERITALSAEGSRIGVEAFGTDFFTEEHLAKRQQRLQEMREAAARDGNAGVDMPDPAQLWYLEERTHVPDWLLEHGWQVSTITAADLMKRYHRPVTADTDGMPTLFVGGVLVDSRA